MLVVMHRRECLLPMLLLLLLLLGGSIAVNLFATGKIYQHALPIFGKKCNRTAED